MHDDERNDFMIAMRDMALRNPVDFRYLVENYPVLGWTVSKIFAKK